MINDKPHLKEKITPQDLIGELIETIFDKKNWADFKEELSFLLGNNQFDVNLLTPNDDKKLASLTPFFKYADTTSKVKFLIANGANIFSTSLLNPVYAKKPFQGNLLAFYHERVFHMNHGHLRDLVVEAKQSLLDLLIIEPLLALEKISYQPKYGTQNKLTETVLDKIITDTSFNSNILSLNALLTNILKTPILSSYIQQEEKLHLNILYGLCLRHLNANKATTFNTSLLLLEQIIQKKMFLNDETLPILLSKHRSFTSALSTLPVLIETGILDPVKQKSVLQKSIISILKEDIVSFEHQETLGGRVQFPEDQLNSIQSYSKKLTKYMHLLKNIPPSVIEPIFIATIKNIFTDFETNSKIFSTLLKDKKTLTSVELIDKYSSFENQKLTFTSIMHNYETASLLMNAYLDQTIHGKKTSHKKALL